MSVINKFLFWLEEHQIGVLTTIAVHLLLLSIAMMMQIRANTARENLIMLDVALMHPVTEEEQQQQLQAQQQGQSQMQISAQEFVRTLRQEYNMRNIPVNTADDRAVENIDKMVRDIKTEMNIADPPPQDKPEENILKEEKALANEANSYEEKYPVNAAGERTIYKGPTTVSYELSGRRHVFMPTPVYKCRSGGKIVVDITVNERGYVIAAEINKSKSDSEDLCIVETAKRDAERSRFNSSSQAKQQGSITYIFQPQ